ncbi:DUF1439 domain-containing protein [Rheinheimera marina]|uniref:DUF1439 domain-containing protein n=1 Tax=Rheinheimera marina TaxID=1774958 RepID=A0ABV9JQP2_9GAMM
MKTAAVSAIATLALLAGCSQMNRIDLYSLSQLELQQQLDQQLQAQAQRGRLLGLPLSLTTKELQLQIAPGQQQQVELKLQMAAELDAVLLPLRTDLMLHLAATPYFDDQKNAVYLSNLQILDSSLGSGNQQFKLQPLSEQAKQLLAMALQGQPVYQLDCDSFSQRMLCDVPLTLQLQPGKLLLKPNYPD